MTNPMVILSARRGQKSSYNILLRVAAYQDVRERTVLPIQDMKDIENSVQYVNKFKCLNTEGFGEGRINPESSAGVYIITTKAA